MTVAELSEKVNQYEESCNIYMNFSVDEDGIWGLPEGSRSQHFINNDKINKYKTFLNEAIKHYTDMATYDCEHIKIRDKYKKYLKRLETAISKLKN
jgi:hypothetical protein